MEVLQNIHTKEHVISAKRIRNPSFYSPIAMKVGILRSIYVTLILEEMF